MIWDIDKFFPEILNWLKRLSLMKRILLFLIIILLIVFVPNNLEQIWKILTKYLSNEITIPIWGLLFIPLIYGVFYLIIKLLIHKKRRQQKYLLDYTKDNFFDINWEWEWGWRYGKRGIYKLTPLCPKCLYELEIKYKGNYPSLKNQDMILFCQRCNEEKKIIGKKNEFFDKVYKEIERQVRIKEL